MAKSLKELVNTYYHVPQPDSNSGGGYGKLNKHIMTNRPMAKGYPYDLYELPEEDEEEVFDEPLLQKRFANKMGKYAASKPDYVSRPGDHAAYFDHSTVGLAGESKIRNYISMFLEVNPGMGAGSVFRMKPRSSEPDGAVNQFGLRVPGGTQFGWSSGYNFADEESYQPVMSLKDLMTKREEDMDRHPNLSPKKAEKWKKNIGREKWEEEQIHIYKDALSASDTDEY